MRGAAGANSGTFISTTVILLMLHRAALLCLGLFAAGAGGCARSAYFSRDAVIREVNDVNSIAEPAPRDGGCGRPLLRMLFADPIADRVGLSPHGSASNVNAYEDVPSSSWFKNWGGAAGHARVMPAADLARLVEDAAARAHQREPFTVWQARRLEKTLVLSVDDSEGQAGFLIFDPLGHPGLVTAAGAVTSWLLAACGYNVPAATVFHLGSADSAQVVLAPGALRTLDEVDEGRQAKLNEPALQRLLAGSHRNREGGYRVLWLRFPAGKPKGGFCFDGRRSDDANDLIPHEDRRELRALRVFCSWLDWSGAGSVQTMDLYVEEQGRRFLRHFLCPLTATLGVGGRAGWAPTPRFEFAGMPDEEESEVDPQRWQPARSNRAFELMETRDALWAVRLLLAFSADHLRAAVAAAHYEPPERGKALVAALLARRDKICQYWLARATPLDNFAVEASGQGSWDLTFDDLEVLHGFARGNDRIHICRFLSYDGVERGREARPRGLRRFNLDAFLPDPWQLPDDPRRWCIAAIRTRQVPRGRSRGEIRVHIYFAPQVGPRLIGIEREV